MTRDRFRSRLEAEPIIETKLRMALLEIDTDPHRYSERPCPTCDPIADLLGEPYGCNRYRLTKHQSRADDRDALAAGGGPVR